jgi:hypothetical protein
MQARMRNPAMVLPGAVEALQALGKVGIQMGGLPIATTGLVQLRAGIVSGWLDPNFVRLLGEDNDRMHAVAAWRDAPYFTDAERAALALTDAVTTIVGTDDPVPDDVWNEAARHYDEKSLGALLICIAVMGVWNRLNLSIKQSAGEIVNVEKVKSRDGTGITLESRGTGAAVVVVDGPVSSRTYGPSMKFASLLAENFTAVLGRARGRGSASRHRGGRRGERRSLRHPVGRGARPGGRRGRRQRDRQARPARAASGQRGRRGGPAAQAERAAQGRPDRGRGRVVPRLQRGVG